MHQMGPRRLLFVLLSFLLCTIIPVSRASVTKKLDQTVVPQEPDAGIKCGSCPCVNPCGGLPPPPPPPPPPPHPPPPPPKTPYCTPLAPPPPRFYYVTSVPGNLYETDPYYQWGLYDGARQNTATWLLLLVGLGVIELLVIW
ncbi:hypothetical protein OIU77_001415 [Salix suchowensis]|uniref:Uncharacterized protein n=1 Tax=Salix suchowensis TaxID=1278906 RepID=A0ABQ9B1C5_9ROSI|nr:hypothetical protein OIU77_001415 [Salix suchowensis]